MLPNIARNTNIARCDGDVVHWTIANVIMSSKKAMCVLKFPTCDMSLSLI